jgi:DNA-binding PadR family transcriptional regulator
MKKDDLKTSILKILMLRELHGYEIGKHLASKGESGQMSYIYQILSEMKNEGLIKKIWLKGLAGPKRKVYSLDTGGWQELQATLRKLVDDVHEFYMDYLARLPPEKWLLKWERMITDIIPDLSKKTIVFVTTRPNIKAYQFALEYYCEKIKGDCYLITNKSELLNLYMKNLVVMNGDHANIPLRKDFVDIVIAFDPPKPEVLSDSIREFCRIINDEGVAAIGYPNIEEQEDPLTVGAFIERIQYGLDKYESINISLLRSTFETCFQSTTSNKTADFTFFIGKTKRKNLKTEK